MNSEIEPDIRSLLVKLLVQKIEAKGLVFSKWNQATYRLLRGMLMDDLATKLTKQQKLELGISLSEKTLKRICEEDYDFSVLSDSRREKSLSKLAIFLGYDSWLDLKQFLNTHPTTEICPSDSQILETIRNACQAEFIAYKQVPHLAPLKLQQYFSKDGPAYLTILGNLRRAISAEKVICDAENPSYFRIIEQRIVRQDANSAVAETKEIWFLRWVNTQTGHLSTIYNNLNEQLYLLKRHEKKWLIECNYYQTIPKSKPSDLFNPD